MIKEYLIAFRGVASCYINQYLSLFVFLRRFIEMDDNEKMPLKIKKLRKFQLSIRRWQLKTYNTFC